MLPVSSFSVDSTDDDQMPESIRASRDQYVSLVSPYTVSGTMEMELPSIGIGALLKSAFSTVGAGVVASAYSGGGYQYVFTPGNSATPTFSFESSAADILVMRYGGIRVNTFEISSAFGEPVTSSWGLEGTTRAKQSGVTAGFDATDIGSALPFHFVGASVKVDTVAKTDIKNFSFGVNNNIERIGTLRKTRNWKRTNLGKRNVTLSMTMDFTGTADYDLFLAQTFFAVEIHLENDYIAGVSGPKHTLKINIPKVKWNMIGLPLQAGSYLEQSAEATILRPADNSPVFTATLVTTDAVLIGG